MKNKLITTSIVLALSLFVGCRPPANRIVQTNNKDYKVELVFEHDGIKVYRFFDNQRVIYYTDARGKTQYETGGKSSYSVTVETLQ